MACDLLQLGFVDFVTFSMKLRGCLELWEYLLNLRKEILRFLYYLNFVVDFVLEYLVGECYWEVEEVYLFYSGYFPNYYYLNLDYLRFVEHSVLKYLILL